MRPTKRRSDLAWHVSDGSRCGGLTSLLCDEQVLETVGRAEEAVEAYKARVALGGWAEETFEAQMRVVSSSRCLFDSALISSEPILAALACSLPLALGPVQLTFL